jgi:hypothetical protein
MPLPPAAEAARAAAAKAQSRRNGAGAFLAGSFVVGVFAYCISAVEQEEITDRDVAEFRKQRELQRQRDAALR